MAANSDEKEKSNFTYIWKIESVPSNADFQSPVFTVQSMEMTKWCLDMRFGSEGACLWLQRVEEDGGPKSIEVEYELSFIHTNGSSLFKRSNYGNFQKGNYSEEGNYLFFKTSELFNKRGDDFFPTNTLTFRFCIWRKGTEISKSELCFARTQFNVYRPSCVWVIKEFSSLQQGEKRIRILNSCTKIWPQLSLTLSIDDKYGKEKVIIKLEADRLRNHFSIEAEIAVLDASGMVISIEKNSICSWQVRGNNYQLSVWGKRKLISTGAVLLSDDVLVLRCELKLISHDPAWSSIEDYKLMDYSNLILEETDEIESHLDESNKTAVCPFKEIIHTFREDGILSDVSLQTSTKCFPVHKLILSSRSSVFKAMFTKDMREKTSKCIDIPDLDADTLSRLLLYIYEDKVQELTCATAVNLYEAADKYELLDLKEKCSSFLKSNHTESNVCNILVLADMHHDESLLKSAQEFIQNNTDIMRSNPWKVFRDNHSKLAWEIAEHIICNMKHASS